MESYRGDNKDKLLINNFPNTITWTKTKTLGEEIEPRYMTVGGIFDAYREKEVKVWGYEDLKDFVDDSNLGLKGSPTQVKKSFTKPVKPAGQLYTEISADEAVEVIINKLKEKYII